MVTDKQFSETLFLGDEDLFSFYAVTMSVSRKLLDGGGNRTCETVTSKVRAQCICTQINVKSHAQSYGYH